MRLILKLTVKVPVQKQFWLGERVFLISENKNRKIKRTIYQKLAIAVSGCIIVLEH